MWTLGDIILTVGMCHLICIRTTTFAETKSAVGILVHYIIVSGALTCLGSIVSLITFCIMTNYSVSYAVVLVLTKVYTNSYLAMLNARKSIRNTMAHGLKMSDVEPRVSTVVIDSKPSSTEMVSRVRATQEKTGVKVEVDIVRQYDEPMLGVS